MYTILAVLTTIFPIVGIIFGLLAIALYLAWLKRTPSPNPVYDSSARYRPSKLPRYFLLAVASLWLVLNIVQISGVMS